VSVCPLITWEWIGRLSPNFQGSSRVTRDDFMPKNGGSENLHFLFSAAPAKAYWATGKH